MNRRSSGSPCSYGCKTLRKRRSSALLRAFCASARILLAFFPSNGTSSPTQCPSGSCLSRFSTSFIIHCSYRPFWLLSCLSSWPCPYLIYRPVPFTRSFSFVIILQQKLCPQHLLVLGVFWEDSLWLRILV